MPNPIPYNFADVGEVIELLKTRDRRERQFISAAVNFLQNAFPTSQENHLRELRESALELFCGENQKQIDQITSSVPRPARNYGNGPVPSFESPEILLQLIDRRGRLEEQIRVVEVGMRNVPVEGLSEMIEGAILMPLKAQLDDLNDRISNITRLMEPEGEGMPEMHTPKGT